MYNLDEMDMTGASAGALCAVLAGCNVDTDRAFEVAARSAMSLHTRCAGSQHVLVEVKASFLSAHPYFADALLTARRSAQAGQGQRRLGARGRHPERGRFLPLRAQTGVCRRRRADRAV